MIYTDEMHQFLNFKEKFEKLIFPTGKPLVVSEDSATFTMVMAIFSQYEEEVGTLYTKESTYHQCMDRLWCPSLLRQNLRGIKLKES